MKTVVVAISAFLLAAPALAEAPGGATGHDSATASETATTSETGTAAQAEDQAERKICRKIELATGSRTNSRRLCLTAEQWRNFSRD